MENLSKIAIWIGFSLGIIGWSAGALGSKGLGIPIFCIGFIISVFGIAYGAIFQAASSMPGGSPFGMRIATIGFCISAIPGAIEIMIGSKSGFTVHYLFPITLALIVFGIGLHLYRILNA